MDDPGGCDVNKWRENEHKTRVGGRNIPGRVVSKDCQKSSSSAVSTPRFCTQQCTYLRVCNCCTMSYIPARGR